MGWIKDRLWRLGDAFEEFPRVLWLSIFYFVIAMVVMLGFFPVLHSIAAFNLMGTTPFYSLIGENYNFLRWGFLVLPALILLWGWADAEDLYLRLKERKYRY